MAASGAISSVVGATSSLIGGGGSSPTQYVPNYESENMVNEAYMSFLSDSYDQQLELVNSQYSIDSDLTDVTYKMYVEQLAALLIKRLVMTSYTIRTYRVYPSPI